MDLQTDPERGVQSGGLGEPGVGMRSQYIEKREDGKRAVGSMCCVLAGVGMVYEEKLYVFIAKAGKGIRRQLLTITDLNFESTLRPE